MASLFPSIVEKPEPTHVGKQTNNQNSVYLSIQRTLVLHQDVVLLEVILLLPNEWQTLQRHLCQRCAVSSPCFCFFLEDTEVVFWFCQKEAEVICSVDIQFLLVFQCHCICSFQMHCTFNHMSVVIFFSTML